MIEESYICRYVDTSSQEVVLVGSWEAPTVKQNFLVCRYDRYYVWLINTLIQEKIYVAQMKIISLIYQRNNMLIATSQVCTSLALGPQN